MQRITHNILFGPYFKIGFQFAKISLRIRYHIILVSAADRPYLVNSISCLSSISSTMPHWVLTPIDLKMERAETPQQLMEILEKYVLSGSQGCSFLAQLAKLQPDVEVTQILMRESKRFAELCELIRSQYTMQSYGNILLTLRSLIYLGAYDAISVTPETATTRTLTSLLSALQTATIKSCTNLNICDLIKFVAFHSAYVKRKSLDSSNFNTIYDGKVVSSDRFHKRLVYHMDLRFKDISSVEDLLLAVNKQLIGSIDLMSQAEDKIRNEFFPNMSMEELGRLFLYWSNLKLNIPQQRKFLFEIAQRFCIVSQRNVCDKSIKKLFLPIINRCAEINLFDSKFFDNILSIIISKCTSIAASSNYTKKDIEFMFSVLTAMAKLRIYHDALFESLCIAVIPVINDMEPENWIALLTSLMKCNYFPQCWNGLHWKQIIGGILNCNFRPYDLLTISYSLAVMFKESNLQRLDNKRDLLPIFEQLFNSNNVSQLCDGENDFKVAQNVIKLLLLKKYSEINGFLDDTMLDRVKSLNNFDLAKYDLTNYKMEQRKEIIGYLLKFMPESISPGFINNFGVAVDGEIRWSSGKLVPCKEWNNSSNEEQRIAIFVLHSLDFARNADLTNFVTDPRLLGFIDFSIWLHERSSNHCFTISYPEFRLFEKELNLNSADFNKAEMKIEYFKNIFNMFATKLS